MNTLFPVFLKTEKAQFLIVGGGRIGLEKTETLLKQNPNIKIKLVSTVICDELKEIGSRHDQVQLLEKAYDDDDLIDADFVIAATNDSPLNASIKHKANEKNILVNAADQPDLCDFYLGSIVNKGNMKIAISTNGKSPVLARRMREYLEESIPDNINETILNLNSFRNKHKGDFKTRLNDLNKVTKSLSQNGNGEKKYKKLALQLTLLFLTLFIGYGLSTVYSADKLVNFVQDIPREFYGMILVGILAQMVDGALGLGYGVISATSMMLLGINLPAISGSIHMAEMVSSGLSGFSHYKFGNVNKKMLIWIAIPGVIGAILGAGMLVFIGEKYQNYAYIILASYTFVIGVRLITLALKKEIIRTKIKKLGLLGFTGGFFDAFGGGGWGPIVTSTLLSKGRKSSFVVGTVSMAEFFVTLAASAAFFFAIGVSNWYIVLGLIIGGGITAPFAAYLAGKIPTKTAMIFVAILVCTFSVRVVMKVIGG
jgi:siroheme synthase-like protein